jgi:hypothetical protein
MRSAKIEPELGGGGETLSTAGPGLLITWRRYRCWQSLPIIRSIRRAPEDRRESEQTGFWKKQFPNNQHAWARRPDNALISR